MPLGDDHRLETCRPGHQGILCNGPQSQWLSCRGAQHHCLDTRVCYHQARTGHVLGQLASGLALLRQGGCHEHHLASHQRDRSPTAGNRLDTQVDPVDEAEQRLGQQQSCCRCRLCHSFYGLAVALATRHSSHHYRWQTGRLGQDDWLPGLCAHHCGCCARCQTRDFAPGHESSLGSRLCTVQRPHDHRRRECHHRALNTQGVLHLRARWQDTPGRSCPLARGRQGAGACGDKEQQRHGLCDCGRRPRGLF